MPMKIAVTVASLAGIAVAAIAILLSSVSGPETVAGSDDTGSVAGVSANLVISSVTDSPTKVIAGHKLQYTIQIANNGPADATNVVAALTLSPDVTFLTGDADCSATQCNLGDLDSGDSTKLTLVVQVSPKALHTFPHGTIAAGVLTSTFNVSADQADPFPENNTEAETTIVQESADLQIYKSCKADPSMNFDTPTPTPTPTATPTPAPSQSGQAPNEVRLGKQLTCTILVDNHGPSSARNIVVIDTLIAGPFVRANGCSLAVRTEGGAIDEFNCNFALSTGVFDLATMGANWLNPAAPSFPLPTPDDEEIEFGRIVITINMTADQAGQVNNTVRVLSDTPDPDTSNNFYEDHFKFVGHGPPLVSALPTPPKVAWGVPIEFSGFATDSDTPQSELKYVWGFGDGNVAINQKVSHAYDKPGVYSVSLQVSDTDNLSTSVSTFATINKRDVGIKNCGPVQDEDRSKFTLCARLIDPYSQTGIMGRTITFDVEGKDGPASVSGSTDGNGEIRLSFDARMNPECNPVTISFDGSSDNLYESNSYSYIVGKRGCATGTAAGYDVNADGRLSALDAALILQSEAGLVPSLSGSTAFSSRDATLVLQYVARLIDAMPAR